MGPPPLFLSPSYFTSLLPLVEQSLFHFGIDRAAGAIMLGTYRKVGHRVPRAHVGWARAQRSPPGTV